LYTSLKIDQIEPVFEISRGGRFDILDYLFCSFVDRLMQGVLNSFTLHCGYSFKDDGPLLSAKSPSSINTMVDKTFMRMTFESPYRPDSRAGRLISSSRVSTQGGDMHHIVEVSLDGFWASPAIDVLAYGLYLAAVSFNDLSPENFRDVIVIDALSKGYSLRLPRLMAVLHQSYRMNPNQPFVLDGNSAGPAFYSVRSNQKEANISFAGRYLSTHGSVIKLGTDREEALDRLNNEVWPDSDCKKDHSALACESLRFIAGMCESGETCAKFQPHPGSDYRGFDCTNPLCG